MRKIRQCCLPILFIPVGHKTYSGVGGIIGLIGPYLIRPESGGVGCTSGGIRATVRTSVGNILFHNSIVVKTGKSIEPSNFMNQSRCIGIIGVHCNAAIRTTIIIKIKQKLFYAVLVDIDNCVVDRQ